MNRYLLHSLGTMIMLVGAAYMAYYVLLHDNPMHCSISSIISHSSHSDLLQHLLVLGLLPIYIAAIIFGAALIGIYLRAKLEILFIRYTLKNK